MANEISGHLCAICDGDTGINGLRYATLQPNLCSEYFCEKCIGVGETALKKKVCVHCKEESLEETKFVVVKKEVPVLSPVEIRRGGATPDVYYGYGSGTHSEENIADPKTGEPIPFWDKSSKRDAMRRAGVREAGDKIHGARNEDMIPQKRKKYFT